jgi:putative two-component system response regulator
MEHKSTILIVDDDPGAREAMEALLFHEGYALNFASNGPEALTRAAELRPDLILLDVMMPDMDGFEVCQKLRASPFLAEVPVIMVTALDDRDSRLQGIESGADEFVSKPFDRIELRTRIRTIIRLNRYHQLLEERANLQRANQELAQAYDDTLKGWSLALELRDNETQGHSERVTQRTLQLARIMGVANDDLIHVRRGALLHDIGKMGIPDSILHKPGPLTEDEWKIMRKHPIYAYDLLFPIAYLRPALDIPYCHHEHWDGSGYPRGLKAETIPQAARIFAVVDVWDALCSKRPYRDPWPIEQVTSYIREKREILFDPQVVDVFLNL